MEPARRVRIRPPPQCGLTLPSSGRPKGRFAPFAPPLMSNVGPHENLTQVATEGSRRTMAYESHAHRPCWLHRLFVVPLGAHGGHSLQARPHQGRCGKWVYAGQLQPLAIHAAPGACSRELCRKPSCLRRPHARCRAGWQVLHHRPAGVRVSWRTHPAIGHSSQLAVCAGGHASVLRVCRTDGHGCVLDRPSTSRVGAREA